jgi:Ca2+-binding RTX toxin-like protein
MTGGAGIDTFTITAADTAIDTILDWNSGAAQDVIATAYTTTGGTLKITYASDSVAANALDLSTVLASFGVASVTGGASSDIITGGAGNDTIVGGGGSDTLVGGTGADSIVGGVSTDLITGGTGIDTVTGGTGIDTFVIAAGATNTSDATAVTDVITDFVTTSDIIKLGTAGAAGGSAAGSYSENLTAKDSITIVIADAEASFVAATTGLTTGVKQAYYFGVSGGNGYLISDSNAGDTANGITVIQLTGVTNIGEADIIA